MPAKPNAGEGIYAGMSSSLSSPQLLFPLLLLAVGCGLISISSWVRGLQVLVVTVVFGGLVGARMGFTALPIIFRDAVIVLPIYVAFVATRAGREAIARVPADLALLIGAFLAWMAICLFNPESVSALQVLIGLKVWIFYIPFLFVGIALAARPNALFRVFRVLLICGMVACAAGLLQSALIRLIGYQSAISLFFGAAASSVTQGFSAFYIGGNIYRIPGTFSFGSQYVAFLFLFLSVAVIEANTDPEPRFQNLGRIAFYVGVLAGLFSGTKGAFLMFPLYALALAMFGLIRARLLIAAPLAIGLGVWAINAAGLDPLGLASFGAQQAQGYGGEFIFQQVADAVGHGIFGEGIGSATGAGRFASIGSASVSRLGFESYFAKTAAELGTVGLVIMVALLLAVAVHVGWLAIRYYGQARNRIIAPISIFIAYVIITCSKGASLDIDPVNVFFWLTLGLVVAAGRAEEELVVVHPERETTAAVV